jgi:predicted PurR-regulated permease PerM
VNVQEPAPRRDAQRIAAAWLLGVLFLAFAVLAAMRGAGRVVIPLLLAVLAGYAAVRFVRKVREPLP